MQPNGWSSKSPHYQNLRLNPGLRHPSRLWTKPKVWKNPHRGLPNAQLKCVRNFSHAHPQLLIFLNDSKAIFAEELPNMGSQYISRLVFDFNAITVFVLIDGKIKGAICSRLFYQEEFIEIAFCGVDSNKQLAGVGHLLMNYLKSVIQIEEFYDLITCADNEAVGYFKKQGFSLQIRMEPQRWVGRIKDYHGVTLVHCQINPEVDYQHFNEAIQKQINFSEKVVGKRLHQPYFTEGDKFLPYPQKPSFLNQNLVDLIKDTDTKGKHSRRQPERKIVKNYDSDMSELKQKLIEIIQQLNKDETLNKVFYEPVTETIAEDYFEQIQYPMDFLTMERRLLRYKDYYKTPELFAEDMNLIVRNCKTFNTEDTEFYKYANLCWQKFKQLYLKFFPNNELPE